MVSGGATIRFNNRGYLLFSIVFTVAVYFLFIIKGNSNEKIKLQLLLETAVTAAKLGGSVILSVNDKAEVFLKGKTKEGLEDRVTTADLFSHCAMKHFLTSQVPTVKFISEEKVEHCPYNTLRPEMFKSPNFDVSVDAKDVTVWIDPLDATHEYTEKLFKYVTTMVCVAVRGVPVIGVIHKPFENKTSWAVVGNVVSEDLKVKNIDKPPGDLKKIIVSRSHRGSVEEALAKSFTNYKLVIAAGAGYKVLEVAYGNADAYIHTTAIKKWDICAGNAILKALDGEMTTKNDVMINYLDDDEVVNTDGLIATMTNHNLYVNKL